MVTVFVSPAPSVQAPVRRLPAGRFLEARWKPWHKVVRRSACDTGVAQAELLRRARRLRTAG